MTLGRTLVPVTAGNWRAALALRVRPEQLPFVADHQPVVAIALAKAHVGAMDHAWLPLLVLHVETPVGFLALTHPRIDPCEAWIFHFFIDDHHQRRGHGRAALHALFARLRTGPTTSLNLLVNPANAAAIALYRTAGFVPTGRHAEGDIHMARPLP